MLIRADKFEFNSSNNDSLQFPHSNDQVLINPRLGIEFLLGLPEHLPQQGMTPSPLAPDENNDNFLPLHYQVDVEALEEWATVTKFKMGGFGFPVEEPKFTASFRDFLLIMYGSNWEKQILRCTTLVIEQLKALITSFCKMTTYQKTQWVEQFDSWPSSTLRVQLKGLEESGGFWK